jgi:hypothetical protein
MQMLSSASAEMDLRNYLNAVKKERKHERRVINIELYILHPKRM